MPTAYHLVFLPYFQTCVCRCKICRHPQRVRLRYFRAELFQAGPVNQLRFNHYLRSRNRCARVDLAIRACHACKVCRRGSVLLTYWHGPEWCPAKFDPGGGLPSLYSAKIEGTVRQDRRPDNPALRVGFRGLARVTQKGGTAGDNGAKRAGQSSRPLLVRGTCDRAYPPALLLHAARRGATAAVELRRAGLSP